MSLGWTLERPAIFTGASLPFTSRKSFHELTLAICASCAGLAASISVFNLITVGSLAQSVNFFSLPVGKLKVSYFSMITPLALFRMRVLHWLVQLFLHHGV